MAERKIIEAGQPFSVTLADGTPLMIAKGDRFYSDDPAVQGREHLFGELTVRSSRPSRPTSADTETASAGPGARRQLSKPAEKAGGKSDA